MRKKLKKALIVFTILGLLGAFCGCSANEQSNDDGTYSATEHNVRQHDDSDSVSSDDSQTESMSEVFGTSQLPESSGVPVASTESAKADIPKSIDIDELEEYYVTGVSSSLSLLQEADDDSKKIRSLSCGEGVLLVNNGSDGYAYVYSESADDFGYVDSHYLVSDENAVCRASTYYISSDGAILYSSVNNDKSELASLTINDKVTVIAKLPGDSWYVKTEQDSVFGYVNFNDLSDKKLTVPNSPSVSSASSSSEYVFADSNSRYLSKSELVALSENQLKIARNEIYARHGRTFDDSTLQAYFNSCSWYKGTVSPSEFSTSVFNSYEKANIELIVAYEEECGYR